MDIKELKEQATELQKSIYLNTLRNLDTMLSGEVSSCSPQLIQVLAELSKDMSFELGLDEFSSMLTEQTEDFDNCGCH